MRTLGRFFPPDAVAAGDKATAETDPGLREETRLSEDGAWWWSGERWLPTSTPDGLWSWDGDRWRPTIELRGVRPHDLATTLAFLAEDRYARAAGILVDRQHEWRPAGELRELVQRAADMRRRLSRAERAFAGPDRPSGLLRRFRASPEERERAGEQQALLDTQFRALMVHLGRHAPRPTVKEADDILAIARVLDRRAAGITQALAAADEAERARVRAIATASRDLQAAEAARLAWREDEMRRRETAEAVVRDRRRERRALLLGAAEAVRGEPLATVGPLAAYAAFVETPSGRLPAGSVRASAAMAVSAWRQHRELLQDVLLLETPESERFQRCLTERRRDLFLLLATPTRVVLWHCPPGEEKPLRRFVTAVNRQAARADEAVDGWLRTVEEAVRAAGPAGQVPADGDGEDDERRLTARIEEARGRLELARGDWPQLVAAREHVIAETRAAASPPPPLAAPAAAPGAVAREVPS